MRKYFSFLILFFFLNVSPAQAPYQLSWKTDGILLGASALMGAVDYHLNQQISLLTTEEIYAALASNEINNFDKIATKLYSEAADKRSDIGMYISSGAALGVSAEIALSESENRGLNTHSVTLAILWLETNIINSFGTDIVKSSVQRTRPYVYNHEYPIEKKYAENARKSFFSGHTSMTAANSFFAAKVFSDYYSDSKWKPVIWTTAALIPAWTGFERVLAGKHFPSDVIAGYIFGAACGYFIPHLHKKHEQNLVSNMIILPYNNFDSKGISMTLSF